jgi:hypothetical protein
MTTKTNTASIRLILTALLAVPTLPQVCPAAPLAGTLVREAVEMAFRRSGREVAEKATREAVEQSVEVGVATYGPRAAQAVAEGGVELVEAVAKYGDDVMRVAVDATPAARRALALEPARMVPLVRELGVEAVEIEARSPGLARRIFTSFGDDGARQIARQVPADDVPRLLAYAEKADSPATRRALLEAYEKEGRSIFERIPPKLVLAGGLSVSMVYGTHRMTAPFAAAANAMEDNPDLPRDVVHGTLWIMGAVAVLTTVFILAAFRLTPWQAARPVVPTERQPN